MAYEIEKQPDESIVIVRWRDSFPEGEFLESCAEVERLRPVDGQVVRIDDVRQLDINFSGIVAGLAVVRSSIPGSPRDPNVKPLLVGSGALWNMVSTAGKQLQYGGEGTVPLYTSIEEAHQVGRMMLENL